MNNPITWGLLALIVLPLIMSLAFSKALVLVGKHGDAVIAAACIEAGLTREQCGEWQ